MWARGSGVSCQMAAASGGAAGSGAPGAAHRGTKNPFAPPARGVARSITNSPASCAPGGSGAAPSRRTAPGGAPCNLPIWIGAGAPNDARQRRHRARQLGRDRAREHDAPAAGGAPLPGVGRLDRGGDGREPSTGERACTEVGGAWRARSRGRARHRRRSAPSPAGRTRRWPRRARWPRRSGASSARHPARRGVAVAVDSDREVATRVDDSEEREPDLAAHHHRDRVAIGVHVDVAERGGVELTRRRGRGPSTRRARGRAARHRCGGTRPRRSPTRRRARRRRRRSRANAGPRTRARGRPRCRPGRRGACTRPATRASPFPTRAEARRRRARDA